jgi:hypothetical protein
MRLFLEIPHWGLIAHDMDMCSPRLAPGGWPFFWGHFISDYGSLRIHFA